MAEAVVEERQLLKTLRWYDGFVICLANPGFMLRLRTMTVRANSASNTGMP